MSSLLALYVPLTLCPRAHHPPPPPTPAAPATLLLFTQARRAPTSGLQCSVPASTTALSPLVPLGSQLARHSLAPGPGPEGPLYTRDRLYFSGTLATLYNLIVICVTLNDAGVPQHTGASLL